MSDVEYFLRISPQSCFHRPRSVWHFLTAHGAALHDYREALAHFPELMIEPLEVFYSTLWGLAALDRDFLETMTTELTWRGVAWGGWLALLAPHESFVDVLENVTRQDVEHGWAAHCALADIKGEAWPDSTHEVRPLVESARDALKVVKLPTMPLRLAPTDEERAVLEKERAKVAVAYKSGGLEAAQLVIAAGPGRPWMMSYPNWLRTQRLPETHVPTGA